ncbi:MAG: histidine phosphatase family protein [Bacteroides sp.]|nr:histidine phosphatase family protein [Bacteroides sp.]
MPATGTDTAEARELPAALDGSMTLYDFGAEDPRVLPDSLTPVSIDYIARHGARYLTSEAKVTKLEEVLNRAEMTGSITEQGRKFRELLKEVADHTAGRWGLLSEIGKEQELRLGREMAAMWPEVFSRADGRGVTSVASYVPRVVQTMDYFTLPIVEKFEGVDVKSASGKAYDRLTRFFVTDSVYDSWRTSGDWQEVYNCFVSRYVSTSPARRLMGDNSGYNPQELRKITYDMYKVLQGMRAAGLPAPTTEWMTPDEYRACWEATNLEKYFQYSLSPLSAIPAAGAKDLLLAVIQHSLYLERGETQGGVNAVFGHAETLLPVFALMGVQGTTALPLDYDNLAKEWSDAELTPLAANLAVIYSRGPSGRLYASMRLNGRNVSPVNDPKRLTVPLSELQEYWLNRLAQLTSLHE